ncbi:MAG: ArsS family sensor histidine kinase [Campylobacter sp.]|nr:ArsS family sensor histidine kinase [Campylobacter sp.]MDO4673848.1 ArsS family sensor histidine kinase [Campylobacter sp.]
MQRYSIRSKLISLLFIVFSLLCVFFVVILDRENKINNEKINSVQREIIYFLSQQTEEYFIRNLPDNTENMRLVEIKNKKLIEKIRAEGRTIFTHTTNYCQFSSLLYSWRMYLSLDCKAFQKIYTYDQEDDRIDNVLLTSFLFFVVLIILTYISLFKSLKPLGQLKDEIIKISHNEIEDFSQYDNDEIGTIAAEFSKAYRKNKDLIRSRQLFLRTIMHELKTPIGKGRIIAEMTKEAKQKKRLIEVFERMNRLINELAKIENLFSKNYSLHLKNNPFSAFLNEAKNYLLRDDFDKIIKIKLHSDPIINADIEIFSLILKNMLDNALKYSKEGTCELECFIDHFVVKNSGEPLKEPIEYYLKAFTRDKNLKKEGMGLGLYIVSEVCKLHGFSLLYEYKAHKHCFKVLFGSIQ